LPASCCLNPDVVVVVVVVEDVVTPLDNSFPSWVFPWSSCLYFVFFFCETVYDPKGFPVLVTWRVSLAVGCTLFDGLGCSRV
jgi:hypothetical protein